MKSGSLGLSGVLLGFLIALVSGTIVFGSFILALIEGGQPLTFAPSPTPLESGLLTPLPPLQTSPAASPTSTDTTQPSNTPTLTHMKSGAELGTATPTPTECLPNPDWEKITIREEDTLKDLAKTFGMTKQELLDGNCIEGDLPPVGSAFYVPYSIVAEVPPSCGPPAGWVRYYVVSGDTLFRLATATGTTVDQIVFANCLKSTGIYTGQVLWLPRYPNFPPSPPTSPPATQPPPTQPTQPPPTDPPPPTDGNISNETITP